MRKRSRRPPAAHAGTALGRNPGRNPGRAESDPPLSSAALVALPLAGLGLLLLLGASVVSAQRVPWPALAEPLYTRRLDLAALGIGAIALALLWLNVTVVF